jgi:beta-lactamase regulating signal transducer with metallopeptidase domain
MMIIAFKASLLLLLAALLDLAVLRKHAPASTRHLVWTAATIALLALPLMSAALPSWNVAMAERTPFSIQPATRRTADIVQTTAPTYSEAAAITPQARPQREIPWTIVGLIAYAIVALLLFLKVLGEHLIVGRVCGAAGKLDAPAWQALLVQAKSELGITRDVELLLSDHSIMPLTFGTRAPRVLLPASALGWAYTRRRSVLLHELAHVARNDCLTQTLAAVTCAMYWPHPGVWYAARRLRTERELACDDRAVMSGVSPQTYARDLLEIAYAHRAPRLVTAAVSMATSSVEQRIHALLEGNGKRMRHRRNVTATVLTLAVLLLPPLAAVRAQNTQVFTGRWTVRPATQQESELSAASVYFTMHTPGLNTFYVEQSKLHNFSPDWLAGTNSSKTFELRRDAGTFRFKGDFQNGRGEGEFEFTPSVAFADELKRRGMDAPTPEQMFTLAKHGMELEFLDGLKQHGYAQPTTEGLVTASNTGVDVAYLKMLAQERPRAHTLDDAVTHWNNPPVPPTPGIPPAPPAFEPKPPIPPEPPRPLVPNEVVPTAPASSTLPPPPPLDPPPGPSLQTPTTGRWIVTPRGPTSYLELLWDDDTQWRKYVATTEFSAFPTIERDAGRFDFRGELRANGGSGEFDFTPRREFIAVMRELGFTEQRITDHDLKNLAWGNIGEAEVREFKSLFSELTLRNVVDMAIRDVTPDYVRSVRAAGAPVPTVREVNDLRFAGITASDVRRVVASGMTSPSSNQIIRALRQR